MRAPVGVSPSVAAAFRELWNALDKLGVSHAESVNLKGKRLINAGDAEDPGDYVTKAELDEALDLAAAAAAEAAATSGGGGADGGGEDDGTCVDTKPDYSSYVQTAKNQLISEGFNIESGPCGGFEIIKRAVQLIAVVDATVGLLDKPSGNNCGGYATDIICFVDGTFYDALRGSGDVGGNGPIWDFVDAARGGCDPTRYRPPI